MGNPDQLVVAPERAGTHDAWQVSGGPPIVRILAGQAQALAALPGLDKLVGEAAIERFPLLQNLDAIMGRDNLQAARPHVLAGLRVRKQAIQAGGHLLAIAGREEKAIRLMMN